MENLYASVRHKSARRMDVRLFLVISAAAAIFLFGIVIMIGSMLVQVQFRSYLSRLSQSTVYAYTHGGLAVTENGERYEIGGAPVYYLYRLTAGSQPGKSIRELPAEEPDMLVEFGDGSSVQLWDTSVRRQGMERPAVRLCYTDREGRQYRYLQTLIKMEAVRSVFEGARRPEE